MKGYKSMFGQRFVMIAMVSLAFVVTGCGGGGDKPDVVQVEGKLFVDGKAFGPATILLEPDDKDAYFPSGTVAEDGTFTLISGKDLEGAPAGTYKVVLGEDVMTGIPLPVMEPLTVEIKKPSDGGVFKLEIKFKSTKDGAKAQAGPGTEEVE